MIPIKVNTNIGHIDNSKKHMCHIPRKIRDYGNCDSVT